jgi:hypothetical protein
MGMVSAGIDSHGNTSIQMALDVAEEIHSSVDSMKEAEAPVTTKPPIFSS